MALGTLVLSTGCEGVASGGVGGVGVLAEIAMMFAGIMKVQVMRFALSSSFSCFSKFVTFVICSVTCDSFWTEDESCAFVSVLRVSFFDGSRLAYSGRSEGDCTPE